MSWITLAEFSEMAGGELVGSDRTIDSISIDTRTIKEGQLFVALQGENFDGHDFIRHCEDIATGAMLSKKMDVNCSQVLVGNTFNGLNNAALNWRKTLNIPIVALTGSNGKTTVKEMITSILSVSANVSATVGNLNNHIGVPLTLLSIREKHDYAVIEVGANHPGEITMLSKLTSPDVALITNAASAHLEGFGDIQGVAKAKAEIFKFLNPNGVAVINSDDKFANYWSDIVSDINQISFGMEKNADVTAVELPQGRIEITYKNKSITLSLLLRGKHNTYNALAATAVCLALGISLENIKLGLEKVKTTEGRLNFKKGIQGSCVIDDTYNANPDSLKAGIDVLKSCPGRHWLVLGDMAELGEQTEDIHYVLGEHLKEEGIEKVFALGQASTETIRAFGEGGQHFEDPDSLFEEILLHIDSSVNILVKGSRFMRLENIVQLLIERN